MPSQFDTLLTVSTDAMKAENEIIDRLTVRAEKYIAAIGVIIAFHAADLPLKALHGRAAAVGVPVLLIGIAVLVAALIMSIASMRVRQYPTHESTPCLLSLAEADDDGAKFSVAKLYLAIRDETLAINERRARRMELIGRLILIGFGLSIIGQLCVQIT